MAAAAAGPAPDPAAGPAARAAAGLGPPWRAEATPLGPLVAAARAHPPDWRHGDVVLARSLDLGAEALGPLANLPAWPPGGAEGWLFVDTETTGLARGAGTLAFLIGLGWWRGGAWHTEQLLVPRPGLEAPALARLAARLAEARALITFNGKSFDWPLLCQRFVLARLPPPPALPHLDLLHALRCLVPALRREARLTRAEATLMNFVRAGDVPGAAIPEMYFRFLRGGPAGLMAAVAAHNALDLAAMAALVGLLGERLAAGAWRHLPAEDALAVARLLARRGRLAAAWPFAEAAVRDPAATSYAGAALYLATLLRRAGRHQEQAALLERALAAAPQAPPLEAARMRCMLAKIYEHRLRAPRRALEHALGVAAAEGEPAAARRRHRLHRKLTVAGRPARPGRGEPPPACP